MALTDKNIVITPNTGSAAEPEMVFSGADASNTAKTITAKIYPTNGGTLSFEGSSGQLFSIVNSMTGAIYSVNDVSGIPSIEVLDTGIVKLAQYSGNVLVGTAIDDGVSKLQVNGIASANTASLGTNTTQLATTAYVQAELTADLATATPSALGTAAVGSSLKRARENHVHAMPTLDSLANTTITSNTAGELLRWSGSAWLNATLAESGIQATLVSGTSIKTVNGTTLLGSGSLTVGDVTLTGTQTLTNKTITEKVFALTGTTPAFTATNGAVQTWTLTAASTPTNALTSGQSIILVIAPGSFAITWPTILWTKQGGSGTLPALFSAGKTSIILWMVGSTLYGSHLGDTT
jgi:hypothetical protein